jgi:hypothetical protein
MRVYKRDNNKVDKRDYTRVTGSQCRALSHTHLAARAINEAAAGNRTQHQTGMRPCLSA